MRAAGEERVGSGCFKGREGENMRKLCNNTQSFVIEKRAGGRKPRKKGREPGMQGTGVGKFGPPIPQIDYE